VRTVNDLKSVNINGIFNRKKEIIIVELLRKENEFCFVTE